MSQNGVKWQTSLFLSAVIIPLLNCLPLHYKIQKSLRHCYTVCGIWTPTGRSHSSPESQHLSLESYHRYPLEATDWSYCSWLTTPLPCSRLLSNLTLPPLRHDPHPFGRIPLGWHQIFLYSPHQVLQHILCLKKYILFEKIIYNKHIRITFQQ